jgi:hypothetical protein
MLMLDKENSFTAGVFTGLVTYTSGLVDLYKACYDLYNPSSWSANITPKIKRVFSILDYKPNISYEDKSFNMENKFKGKV